MKRIRVLCGGATPGTDDAGNYDRTVKLNARPGAHDYNVEIHVGDVVESLWRNLSDLGADLIDIAGYIYAIDTSVSRGGEADVGARNWQREFSVVIPVRRIDVWQRDRLRQQLTEVLDRLSGDRYDLLFVEEPTPVDTLVLDLAESPLEPPATDCVCLLSGGLDSLLAAAQLMNDGHSPLLVGHRSNNRMAKGQKTLANALKDRFGQLNLIQVRVHRHGTGPADSNQRARSFLFLTLASVIAYEMGLERVVVGENGLVSLNLHLAEEVIDTMATRSTRPDVLALYQDWIRSVTGRELVIDNPLLYMRKSEVMTAIEDLGLGTLVSEAVSCAHVAGRPREVPHCGLCSQCVDRRFAAAAAGLEHLDPPTGYGVDIFYDSLGDSLRSKVPTQYLAAAHRRQGLNADSLLMEYPELNDLEGFLSGGFDVAVERLADLVTGHAREVVYVMGQKTNERYDDVYSGALPDDCLVSVAAQHQHTLPPVQQLLGVLKAVLCPGLRIAYRQEDPESENDLQNKMQALFSAAGERLNREAPAVPFSVISYRPDFSQPSSDLFVEAKMVRSTSERRRIVHEMAADIPAYLSHSQGVLFVVWADREAVPDPDAFAEDLLQDNVDILVVP